MKFAKELDHQAVAEWKARYLDYKQAKKKLKGVRRAVRTLPAAPTKQDSTPGNSLRDAPVSALLRRYQQGSFGGNSIPNPRIGHVRSFSDSHDVLPLPPNGNGAKSQPQQINERSPLNPKGKSQHDDSDRPCMTSYGSIIGSPPHHPEVTRFNSRQAPSVELPPPAVNDDDDEEGDDDEDEDEDDDEDDNATLSPTSPTSPGFPKQPKRVAQPGAKASIHPTSDSPELHPPATQMGHIGSAYQIRPAYDQSNVSGGVTASRLRSIFPQRTNSTPGGRPFMKRMFTSGGGSQKPKDDHDVALEAYRELDFRKAEFFLYLDKELMKVEKFYHEKETEAKERLDAIREQLHMMRSYRLQEIMKSEAGHGQTGPNGDAQGRTSKEESEDGRLRKRDLIAKPISKSIDFGARQLDKVRSGPIGKTSRQMGILGTPEMPGAHWMPEPAQKDYARQAPEDVPYRAAKRKMKLALAELYRGLELLKSYAILNRTAFRKINKKYDKCVDANPQLQYMDDKVSKSNFVTSELPEQLMSTIEDLYARYFEKGSRKVAVSKLRTKIERAGDYSGAVARASALLTAGSVFGIQGLVRGAELLFDADQAKATFTSYLLQLYAGYFMMVFLSLLFCACAGMFNKFQVNYQFIFELDNRQALNWLQLLEIPAFLYFLLGIVMWLNFDVQAGGNTMFIYWIVVLVGLAVASFFLPAPVFYHKARIWFIATIWRLLFAGIYAVNFRDFFTGDMLCSLTYSIGNIEVFFCLFVGGNWNTPAVCNSGHSRLLGFLTCLPGIWRTAQCFRRYYESRQAFPHLANLVKYLCTIAQYFTLSIFRIDQNYKTKAVFILFATINGTYCSIWDLFMDWSLGDPHAKHKFLRGTLAYRKHVWVYYLAMIIDPILRFNWIFYVIYASDSQHSSIVSFLVSFSEILRRGMWTLFRVENEHCTNVEASKASRDVALPYKLSGQESTDRLIHSPAEQVSDDDASPPATEFDPTTIPGDLVPNQNSTGKSAHPRKLGSPDIKPKPAKSPYPSAQSKHDDRRQAGTSEISKLDLERQESSNSSPLAHALSRVGTTIRAAHAFDYTRKKPSSDDAAADGDDDDDDDDSEQE
ncbi:Putative SPX domain, Syg1 family protein [Septoria linicola]|uniref:SPX domain, Syg1 family protein n=1 Tax=Septoria linicola TaxID=215465 RepID=A0A9Q9AKY1_9PEZI|nr:putative SPX domain, Syg1 family protein [Septoria linicola]USW51199.1 Putative SPX domain, Syg1 family protein [Septoria linicola]